VRDEQRCDDIILWERACSRKIHPVESALAEKNIVTEATPTKDKFNHHPVGASLLAKISPSGIGFS